MGNLLRAKQLLRELVELREFSGNAFTSKFSGMGNRRGHFGSERKQIRARGGREVSDFLVKFVGRIECRDVARFKWSSVNVAFAHQALRLEWLDCFINKRRVENTNKIMPFVFRFWVVVIGF